MCNHRPSGKWARIWAHYLLAVFGAFTALEVAGMADAGKRGTLSAYLRHVAGADPRCQHVHFSRLLLIGLFSWAIAHLGWGFFGYMPRRWRSTC